MPQFAGAPVVDPNAPKPRFGGVLVDDTATVPKPRFGGVLVDDTPAAPAEPSALEQTGKNAADLASQGMSGLYQGAAHLAGAPADLVNWIMEQGAKGINGLDGGATNLHMPEHPFGGSDFMEGLGRSAGLITPESTDPALQIMRKIGDSVGGALIPGLGLEAKAGGTLAHALTDMIPAATSGLAGGLADQVAPGNQAAELGAELVGGLVPTTAFAAGRKVVGGPQIMDNRAGSSLAPLETNQGPALADLQAAKNAAYEKAHNLGVVYTPQGYQDLLGKIQSDATADGIHPGLHSDAQAVIDRMANVPTGYAPTLQELDQYRQLARRDSVTSSDERNAHFGNQIVGNIDDFMDNAAGHQIAAGNGLDGIEALQNARTANGVYKKTETLDDLVTLAQRASQGGPSGSLDMSLRQRFKTILDNPDRARGFTPDELAAMEDIVRPSSGEKGLRVVAGLAPSGNGIKSGLGMAGAMVNAPATAAAMAVGAGAKALVNNATSNKVAQLRALIASGGMRRPPAPFYSPQQGRGLTAMLASTGANAATGPRTVAPPEEEDPLMSAVMR